MFTIISRIIHYGWNGFWRNGWLSAATVATMVVALSLSIGLILFNVTTKSAVNFLQDKIDISVYFKTNTPEDEILKIKNSLESLSEVKTVEYISSDKALEIFKATHEGDSAITQAINELNTNPLEASLNIKAKKPDQYAAIAEYLESQYIANFVDTVSYSKNHVVIERLNAIIENVNRGGLVSTIFLAFVAGLVAFNTVRLAIYSNRDEIGIMRVVGASNSLVRGPYMVEGMIAGFVSAVLSVIIAAPVFYFVSPYLKIFISNFDIFKYFYTNVFSLLGYQILFGVLIGGLSSFVAVRRYLKN